MQKSTGRILYSSIQKYVKRFTKDVVGYTLYFRRVEHTRLLVLRLYLHQHGKVILSNRFCTFVLYLPKNKTLVLDVFFFFIYENFVFRST